MKKKFLSCFAVLALGCMMFTGCSSTATNTSAAVEEQGVVTEFANTSATAFNTEVEAITTRKGTKISIVTSTTIFIKDTTTTKSYARTYTLSLPDALPIYIMHFPNYTFKPFPLLHPLHTATATAYCITPSTFPLETLNS